MQGLLLLAQGRLASNDIPERGNFHEPLLPELLRTRKTLRREAAQARGSERDESEALKRQKMKTLAT